MIKSRYLEKLLEEASPTRKAMANKHLFYTILLLIIAIAAYIGLPLLDPRAAGTGTMLAVVFGFLAIFFAIRFISLNSQVSEKTISKCQREIEKTLKPGETIADFDEDIMHAAFGNYKLDFLNISVGRKFVLFQRFKNNGPSFNVLRGDILGEFTAHYFSEGGVGTDIGIDIKDKNGKFIKSLITSDKKTFYEVLNALENLKSYVNGEFDSEDQAAASGENEFVSELKNKVKAQDKNGLTKVATLGIFLGLFLCIAGNSSGEAFIYAGIAIFILSVVSILFLKLKK